jgi:energy-coupling factor transporter ATP-binding protein EcfA2
MREISAPTLTDTVDESVTHRIEVNTEAGSLPDSPFVGLRPFESTEALLFFGRREQTTELLQLLHRTHFLAVVGSSGCGKSSLIRAGLIPKLKGGFLVDGRDSWRTAAMKPGNQPLESLATALLELNGEELSQADVNEFVDLIRLSGGQAIIRRLTPLLERSDVNLLLLVDQFEEIFRFGVQTDKPEQRAEATDFVSIILGLAQQRKLPIYVVMTMRSDFLGDCDAFYGLPEAMNQSQYLVPRLTREQRREAVEGPIQLYGETIAPRLLDRVLNDVSEDSDQLPILQHVLLRTWEHWQKKHEGPIDIPNYEAVGTVSGALSIDADKALEGMDDEDLEITKRLFQSLTDMDAKNRRIRRPAHLSEIEKTTGASREKIMEIVERFRSGGRSFLNVYE